MKHSHKLPLKFLFASILLPLLAYFFIWPSVIDPVAWKAPDDKGLIGAFLKNTNLKDAKIILLPKVHGPEDFAIDSTGIIYTGTDDGSIFKLDPSRNNSGKSDGDIEVVSWVNTGGRALGMEFDQSGHLIVADAELGLLSISPSGEIHSLINEFEGEAFGFVDDLDITQDGRIIFSDASSKFSARNFGGAYNASKLDINEHGAHGRVFVFNPNDKSIKLLAEDLNFANGIAISHDQDWVLVNESGSYRVLKIGINEDNYAEQHVLIDNLPGFPDNIAAGSDGLFWLGLVSPRNAILDMASNMAWLREIAQKMPAFLQPKASRYGHLVAMNIEGEVVHSLQGNSDIFAYITGAVEQNEFLYLSSLHEGSIARIKKPREK